MESELQKFRRRKQLEETKEEIKSKLRNTANTWVQSLCDALLPNWNDEDVGDDEGEPLENGGDVDPSVASQQGEISNNESASDPSKKRLMYIVQFLRFLAWLLVFVGFVKIGFGAVYFAISLLIFIYWNTRKSRRRRKGEVSAYSVFNKDCQAIDGTLKAEHLEKQLLYRNI
ncbi:unnamed protein product [Orchesella dallaii]|uniref:SAYSvFN domain-containing protein n=1 Tax=Orchesella dallaii TaxID=48710 RepID=A0ABP1S4J8_9HEXA